MGDHTTTAAYCFPLIKVLQMLDDSLFLLSAMFDGWDINFFLLIIAKVGMRI